MKVKFKAKYLQYLLNKNENQGFSWVDLLYVIIILGILAAIVLPGMFSQIHKAKQSEARHNIGAMNRAQQSYFLEHQNFTTDFAQLRLGIKTETTNYSYRIQLVSQNGSFQRLNGKLLPRRNYVMNIAQAKKPQLTSYIGIVGTVVGNVHTGELLTVADSCESDEPTTLPPPLVATENGEYLGCPKGYHGPICWKGKAK